MGVALLQFCCASKWHEDVPTSPILLERNEATHWRFCSIMSHVSVGQVGASKANRVTLAIRDS